MPPLTLSLPDGTRISVTGKIDRVDTFTQDGKTYLRVLDYKTGGKEFKLGEVVEGINLQMFIYLFTLCRDDLPRYGGAKPAGVLYLPTTMPVIDADKSGKAVSDEEREQKQLKHMQMDGLLIDDPVALEAMDTTGSGSFIPNYSTQKGAAAHLATLDQLGRLKRRMEDLLLQMAQMLRAGKIGTLPFENGNWNACDRSCDYRDVCGFEDGDPRRTPTLGLQDRIVGEEATEPTPPHE